VTTTRAVNVKHAQSGTYIYCGRRNYSHGFLEDSPFCNQFTVAEYGMAAGPMFVEALMADTPKAAALRARVVTELPGHDLGCWCVELVWKPGRSHRCHCDVLAALADGDMATVEAARSLVWWTTPPAGMAPPRQTDLFGKR